MKTILISLLATLVFEGLAFAGLDTDIAETNRVILSSGRWTPSSGEIQKALTSIQAFLEDSGTTNNRTTSEIKKILTHTKEYRVQFAGVVRDGKRLIRCNFFPANEMGFDSWRRQEVQVFDGGFWFWRIEYDPNTGKCTHFASNGYA